MSKEKDDPKFWRKISSRTSWQERTINNYKWLWVNKRGVLARRGWIRLDPAEGELLLKYCKLSKEGIVEIGRRDGGSTCLITAESTVPVISIDISSLKRFKNAEKTPRSRRFKDGLNPCVHWLNKYIDEGRLTLITERSDKVKLTDKYDVLFVDGNHSYNGVIQDIRNYWENLTGYAIFHDYRTPHASQAKKPGVTRAVHELLLDTKCGKVIEHVGELLIVKKVKEL